MPSGPSPRFTAPPPSVPAAKTASSPGRSRTGLLWLLTGAAILAVGIPLRRFMAGAEWPGTLWMYPAAADLAIFIGGAGLLIGAAVWGSKIFFPAGRPLQLKIFRRMQISSWRLPLAAGGMAFAFLGAAAAGDKPLMLAPAAALAAWAAGIVLMVAAFWSNGPGIPGAGSIAAWGLLVSLLAFVIRLSALDLPPICGDEGQSGMDALQFLQGSANTFFRPVGYLPFSGFFFFLESVSVQWLGRTVAALRIPSAVAGSLGVGVLYLAGRALFGHKPGLIAALLLAASPLHLAFSRIGLNNIWDALGYTAFVGAVWFAWTRERRSAFLLAGLSLGMAQYFYESSLLLWLLALGWMSAAYLADRARFRRNAGGWIGLWLVAGIAVLPHTVYLLAHPQDIFGLAFARSILSSPELAAVARSDVFSAALSVLSRPFLAFAAFFLLPSTAWYTPGTPLLRPLDAAFFLAALVFLVIKFHDLRSILLFGWLGVFLLIGAFSRDPLASQRYVGAAPLCALLTAFGIVQISSRLTEMVPRWMKKPAWGAAILPVLLLADNLFFFFGDYLPNSRFQGKYEFEGKGVAAGNRVVELLEARPGHYEVVYLPGGLVMAPGFPSPQFLIPDYQSVVWDHPYGSEENPDLEGSRWLFIIPPERKGELEAVRMEYPGGTTGETMNWNGVLLFYYYDVSTAGGMTAGIGDPLPGVFRKTRSTDIIRERRFYE